MARENSRKLLKRAAARIPGAVNSPVRAWAAVGGKPIFIASAEGSWVVDCDGNRLIDYVASYGPAVLGHAHPAVVEALTAQAGKGLGFGASTPGEVELAETICAAIEGADKVRLVNSGTEAGMTALRIARAATGREKIMKFDGSYHGHHDSLLVRAGSGGMTLGIPDSSGVPQSLAASTVVVPYNSVEEVRSRFEAEPDGIACVIVEPVAANMGVVAPEPDFIRSIGDLAHRYGALLICDEVITGFRLRFGTFSEGCGARPDLIMLGKIIGGGLPIGAVAGRADLMDLLAPNGPVYQAGTLSGNPLSVAAGLATLRILSQPGTYERLEAAGARLASGLRHALETSGKNGCVNCVGSLLTLFHQPGPVRNATDARQSDSEEFARFFHGMIARGINIPPSQFEAMFVSTAHSDEDIERTIEAAAEALADASTG